MHTLLTPARSHAPSSQPERLHAQRLQRIIGALLAVVALLPAVGATTGCNARFEEGSGVEASEDRDTGSFSAIEAHSGLDITLVSGAEHALHLSGDDNLLPLIRTEVIEDVLIVEPAEEGLFLMPQLDLVVEVTTPHLSSAIASGGSSVKGSVDCEGDEALLRLKGTGGARFELDGVDVGAVFVELSGGSRATLLGEASVATLDLSGGSTAELWDLPVLVAEVELSGGSQANMAISLEVSGSLSGGSELDIIGDPTVEVETSGGSDVDTRELAPAEEDYEEETYEEAPEGEDEAAEEG